VEQIPPLTDISASIFVPLQDDDIANFEAPRDRVERLKRILKTVDYHREGVKENLLYMFEREKRRIVQQAAEIEKAQGPPKAMPGLSPNEVDEVIANMAAPAKPNMDYDIRNMLKVNVDTVLPPNATIRDKTVMDLLIMVEKGLVELEGFEKYMDGIKGDYLARLEREVARIEDAGKRPEERRESR
jgi:hypothetical protein